jgi:hypothetical protein
MALAQNSVPFRFLAVVAAAVLLAGCKDRGKVAAGYAKGHASLLAGVAAKEFAALERGVPEGGKKATVLFYAKGADPKSDPIGVRRDLLQVERAVPELLAAPTTFAALADESGLIIRNNLEMDAMAGVDLFRIYPGLKQAASKPFVSEIQSFVQASDGKKNGPDDARTFVSAARVPKDDGTVGGFYVTGWGLRTYAFHLREALLTDLDPSHPAPSPSTATATAAAPSSVVLPILYVALFDEAGVYTARGTPDADHDALRDLHLVEATEAGPASAALEITGRDFGWAAVRVPAFGAKVGVVVLRSEIN